MRGRLEFAPRIIIDQDWVEIEGIKIMRPSRIGRSQWLIFWGEQNEIHCSTRIPAHCP